MFSIDAENTIRLLAGESSELFPLFVNRGNSKQLIPYEFTPRIRYECRDELDVRIDDEFLIRQIGEDGIYSFSYIDNNWMLNNKIVNLADYGIELNQYVVENFENITIYFHRSIDEIYFYIYDYNMDISANEFYVKKTFTAEGTIFTEYHDRHIEEIDEEVPLARPDGSIWLYIDKEDTKYLDPQDLYLYAIKIKMYDFKNKLYTMNTIMENNKFYLLG